METAATKTRSLPAQAEEGGFPLPAPGGGLWALVDAVAAAGWRVIEIASPGKRRGARNDRSEEDRRLETAAAKTRSLPTQAEEGGLPLPAPGGGLWALVDAVAAAGWRVIEIASPGKRRGARNDRVFGGLTLFVMLFAIIVSACGPVAVQGAAPIPADIADRQIKAVATTGMVGDLVRNVGGERVNVTTLMGPGIDPHLYKPSERSVVTLADADVIFYNGLHLEAGMARVFERMEGRKLTVAVTDSIDRSQLAAPPEFQGNYDPHVWFDVSMWMQTVETVRAALAEMDPEHAGLYQANAKRYLAELEELHAYVQEQAKRIPPEKRVLITAHDAFNYFGQAYGFEVRGLQGISTATEAGTGDVQELAAFIEERQIPAMFVETSVSPRTIEAVQAAVRARGFDVQIGGALFSDAMGNPGTPEGNYLGMVRHNIDTIVAALAQETALHSGE